MTRREFARSASVAFALPALFPGQACAQNKFWVRKELNSLTVAEWDAFDKVVGCMIDTDKTWKPVAEIHNESCPHGNWFFLPWHRAYIHAFEQHARTICKDFTLPYWDWTARPDFPKRFLEMGNLKRATRVDANLKRPARADVVGQNALDLAFSTQLFTVFGGRPNPKDPKDLRYDRGAGVLEIGPHGGIHLYVGQNLGKQGRPGDMFTDLAPLDPIFWVHHANVDRLWAEWCYERGRPPKSKTWPDIQKGDWATKRLEFTINKKDYNYHVSDCLSTFDMGYTYESFGSNKKDSVVTFPEKVTTEPKQLTEVVKDGLVTTKSATTVEVTKYTADEIKMWAIKVSNNKEDTKTPGEIHAWVDFSSVPLSGGILKVFVNNPKADQRSGEKDSSYAGSIVFFPRKHGHTINRHHTTCVALTKALRATDYFKKPEVGISLTFVADSIAEGEESVARIERLSIEMLPVA
ncbi:polyphenol oxidase : Tyrosinase, putative OS=Acaryochloris marina (strain MBIC 11017) GN=AM1_B0356 PE=4 SV=1: Tyrosinase: Tyrosinase: PPO1_KFDV [Gemmata massiliana]|uniref:Tyrosinase copper-binding domain-containing protein n=1 Tax=Gemmata massiliana TaxID=1210884 RepID=A0A6P2D548_9BACT|nr:tyrosinase family protein [Gemmata massiliana]VTR96027.1 polyphenol oxidase : Tyrosinase, putative OS=Acaryochloris marina (strain MBIC 11017) GN=AM1_B0356 PE=4 SV=1: Tyrosinase: Tyrosinase: PPO1_KFDV [Gemmata massiliana]